MKLGDRALAAVLPIMMVGGVYLVVSERQRTKEAMLYQSAKERGQWHRGVSYLQERGEYSRPFG